MNEIKNIFLPNEEIYQNLKDYINENASVSTKVARVKIRNEYPLIVFEEARNELNTTTTTYDNTTRLLNYNVNIYCSDRIDNFEVCQELVVLVTNVMQGYYKMQGGLVTFLTGFEETDKSSCQANLRFTSRFIPTRNKLY